MRRDTDCSESRAVARTTSSATKAFTRTSAI
jgi:hypothetical protein